MATKMKIGYIVKSSKGFSFKEATYTRKINSRGDKIYSKMLLFPVDYDEVVDNTEMMKTEGLVVVQEPFLLDEELREKAIRWCSGANKTDSEAYDPFATQGG